TVVVYTGCIMVYFWASLIYWLLAKRARAFVPQLTVADYELFRNRAVRGCLLITAVFVLNLVRLFLG
ncbi:MAG TPA: hypothetical protein VE078_02710, partial [Thermoanaerobaculia bacterium]|nr:hypothetical protein [Thermoanaerobaculia bacterium]